MTKGSVIFQTFNRADTIMRAIKSPQAQTFRDWELVVMDDGSADDTVDLTSRVDPRLLLTRQENRGFARLALAAGSAVRDLASHLSRHQVRRPGKILSSARA